ncbi:MAG: hypothetical protein ACYSWX_01475 [Planctomycetota bacterium]|jgi:hypothetical protein
MSGLVPRAFFALAFVAAPLSAQQTLEIEVGPVPYLGFGAEMLFFHEHFGVVTGGTVDVRLVSNEQNPWELEFAFGLPSGTLEFTSTELGWSGPGTFEASFATDAFNGPLGPLPGADAYLGFSSWQGGLLAEGGSTFQVDTVAPLNGHLEELTLTLTFEPCGGDPQPMAWPSAAVGSPGGPLLGAFGDACAFEPSELRLTGSVPGQPALLVAGLGLQGQLLGDAILWPRPDILIPIQAADAHGGSALPLQWPESLLPGVEVYLQAWCLDPSSPTGLAATNGLTGWQI